MLWWLKSACQCRGHRFQAWSGKILHAEEQLSPCATTTEARRPRLYALQQKKPPQWGAHAQQWWVAPARHNYRKPENSNQDPARAKIKYINLKKKKKSLARLSRFRSPHHHLVVRRPWVSQSTSLFHSFFLHRMRATMPVSWGCYKILANVHVELRAAHSSTAYIYRLYLHLYALRASNVDFWC